MQLEKPKLFPEKKTFVWVMVVFLCLIVVFLCLIFLRIFIEYQSYQSFISKPFYYTHAKVLNVYEKSKGAKRYQVLKLRSDDGFTFYTTNYSKDDFNHKRLRLQIFPDKSISFGDYLGTFYVKSRIKDQEILPLTFKDDLLKKVAAQHEDTSLLRERFKRKNKYARCQSSRSIKRVSFRHIVGIGVWIAFVDL
jgi:competence protein ComEC